MEIYKKENNDFEKKRICPVFDRVVFENLNIRARNTLAQAGVANAADLLTLRKKDLVATPHCGEKTAEEILSFRRSLERGKFDLLSGASLQNFNSSEWISKNEEGLALNALINGLSTRARNTLERMGLNSLDDFLQTSLMDVPVKPGTGCATTVEIQKMKGIFIDFLSIDNELKIDNQDKLNKLCDYIFKNFVSDSESWLLDPYKPFESIMRWVTSTSRGITKVEQAFLLRMGLAGEPATTLEKAGGRLGLTRERVRQLNKEFKSFSEWIVAQRRMEPIIARIALMTKAHGGKIDKTTLLREIGREEGKTKSLEHASRFIDFISDFEPWIRHGMGCRENDVFLYAEPS